MNAVSTKVLLRYFPSSLRICVVYFELVMPRHLLSPCYARFEYTRGIKRYVTYQLACYVRVQVQSMPYYMSLSTKHACVSLETIRMVKMGTLEEKCEQHSCTDCIDFLWPV